MLGVIPPEDSRSWGHLGAHASTQEATRVIDLDVLELPFLKRDDLMIGPTSPDVNVIGFFSVTHVAVA